jgi:hypothetical protein
MANDALAAPARPGNADQTFVDSHHDARGPVTVEDGGERIDSVADWHLNRPVPYWAIALAAHGRRR